MAAEVAEDRAGLGGGKVALVLPSGDRGEHLDGRDPGDIQPVAGPGPHERTDPRTAGLVHMAFDEGAGIEEVARHQRRSRMTVSDNGSPLIVIGSSSGSS